MVNIEQNKKIIIKFENVSENRIYFVDHPASDLSMIFQDKDGIIKQELLNRTYVYDEVNNYLETSFYSPAMNADYPDNYIFLTVRYQGINEIEWINCNIIPKETEEDQIIYM